METGDLLSMVAETKEKKTPSKKYVTFVEDEWTKVENYFGRRVEAGELKALILALGEKVQLSLIDG